MNNVSSQIANLSSNKLIQLNKNKFIYLFTEYGLTNSVICAIGDKFKNIKLSLVDNNHYKMIEKQNSKCILHVYKNENIIKSFIIDNNTQPFLLNEDITNLDLYSFNISQDCVYFGIEIYGEFTFVTMELSIEMYSYEQSERKNIAQLLNNNCAVKINS